VVGQIGNAQDLQAQVNLTNASHAAMALAAEGSLDPASGGYAVADVNALMEMAGGGVTFTSAESADPNEISVATSQNEWAAAALSESGTCLYIHVETDVVFYGSGQTCTGQAAMTAGDQAW
jgi:type II secretory pathway pseudopilin PulG